METVFALETHLVERHGLSPSDAATESLAVFSLDVPKEKLFREAFKDAADDADGLFGALINRDSEVERLRKALDTISRMTRIANPEVHEIAKEALRGA